MSRLSISFSFFLLCFVSAGITAQAEGVSLKVPLDQLYASSDVYEENRLEALDFVVGAIGGGSVRLNGQGRIHRWSCMGNSIETGAVDSFFGFSVNRDRGSSYYAIQTNETRSLQPADKVSFRGIYPFARFDYKYSGLPLKVSMSAFNPKIPLNLKDSALPCAVFEFEFENTSDNALDITFFASQLNLSGYRDDSPINSREHLGLQRAFNRISKTDGKITLYMDSATPPGWNGAGNMTLSIAADTNACSGAANWTDIGAVKDQIAKHKNVDFLEFEAIPYPWVRRKYVSLAGMLSMNLKIEPGEKASVPVFLSWYFPNAANGMLSHGSSWDGLGRQYANWFEDSAAVEKYVLNNFTRLNCESVEFVESFYKTSLPNYILNRINAQIAVPASPTCFIDKDGNFGGWEGRWQEYEAAGVRGDESRRQNPLQDRTGL
ncbi:putative bile acid beta-glucosidase [Limihaloglobus sulfuriphilus]|uniref:Putative bile acid beta-glucosidase n=1 Tax=Limihaloglobus sulfuriphilus TaxID=1851148 RepID=A0A1Q2MEN0_9BACT|nr:GH116 family glycosyl-hydrolase [Limihaloglobus sulfuriphilus]AQQ71109.1 putative bile acid beta-glucosidase [Limihaloglobus sulfuriphilus]